MTLRDIWSQTGKWLGVGKLFKPAGPEPQIDEEGLICQDDGLAEPAQGGEQQGASGSGELIVKAVPQGDIQSTKGRFPAESLEKLQQSFERLVEQLQGINEHLNRQATQHEELMSRIKQLPKILEDFPAVAENQKQVTEQLFEQLKASVVRSEQFIDAVEKIPAEAVKQTDALTGIGHQLGAAADIDVQMAESLNGFNQALERLNQKTISQTDSIDQMSKTFAASDRYLKYIISQQSKRFMWIFIAAVSVCVVVILILTGVIIYLRSI